jgi:hypothetical protein
MKTYFIDGNSMHLSEGQDEISDAFFVSEIPESNATDAQRQDAIRFWLSEGWMDEGDVVVWDGVRYIVGGESPTLEKRMRAFLSAAQQVDGLVEALEEAFRLSMVDNYPQASRLWLEGKEIKMDSFLSDEEAIAEMARHAVAFIVPKSWHEKKECDWIWVEKDENHESDTFGEDLWCCSVQVMGVSDEVAHFVTMSDMWDTLLDYVDNDWLEEADAVIEYVGRLGNE